MYMRSIDRLPSIFLFYSFHGIVQWKIDPIVLWSKRMSIFRGQVTYSSATIFKNGKERIEMVSKKASQKYAMCASTITNVYQSTSMYTLRYHIEYWMLRIAGWVQDCSIFIANTLEILQSCTEPSICRQEVPKLHPQWSLARVPAVPALEAI